MTAEKTNVRAQILQYFRKIAAQENGRNSAPALAEKLEDQFEPENTSLKFALVLPQSIGDIVVATSLLVSARQTYPSFRLYFICDPKYFSILEPLVPQYLDKLIPYNQQYDSQLWMEGFDAHKGVVDVVKYLHFPTQRVLAYLHNGKDEIAFNINS